MVRHLSLSSLSRSLLAAALLLGCGSRSASEEGGETHFLIKCDNDDTCTAVDAELHCRDGYCREGAPSSDVPAEELENPSTPEDTQTPQVEGSAHGESYYAVQPDAGPASMDSLPPTDNPDPPSTGNNSPPWSPSSGGWSGIPPEEPTGDYRTSVDAFEKSFASVELLGELRGTIGMSSSIVGDIDGDGYDDVVVMDGGNSGPPISQAMGVRGAAYLFYGRPHFPTQLAMGQADLIVRGGGESVEGIGDVNGDGRDDFAFVTQCQWGDNCGVVNGLHIIYGSSTRYSGEIRADQIGDHWVAPGATRHMRVSKAGDVNLDGFSDMLVNIDMEPATWETYLLSGRKVSDGDLAADAAMAVFRGGNGLQQVNLGAAGVGDIDGDQYPDILIAVGLDDSTERGFALFYGGADRFQGELSGADADAIIDGLPIWFVLGPVGDLDQDGYDELAFPTYAGSTPDGTAGLLGVTYGGSNRLSGSYSLSEIAAFSLRPIRTLDGLASADLNGDGWLDLLLGDSKDRTLQGRSGNLAAIPGEADRLWADLQVTVPFEVAAGQIRPRGAEGSAIRDSLGYGTAAGGDVNGDGYEDALVGALGNVVGDDDGGRVWLLFGSPLAGQGCIENSQCEECHVCDIEAGAAVGSCVIAPGSPCGDASDTECDEPDTCDATGTCLTNRAPQGTSCGNSADPCVVGVCDGTRSVCPRFEAPECSACVAMPLPSLAAVASSNNGSSHAAGYAIDARGDTYWQGVRNTTQWIYFDLGTDVRIVSAILQWSEFSSKDYQIQVAADGACSTQECLASAVPWTPVYATSVTNSSDWHTIPLDAVGRYVRVLGTDSTTPAYSLANISIYGLSSTDCLPLETCTAAVDCGQCHTCSVPEGSEIGTCVPVPAGTGCGSSSSSVCDNPDTCNTFGACVTNRKPMGSSCYDDVNSCTLDGCNGVSLECANLPLTECGACSGTKLTPTFVIASSMTETHGVDLAIDNDSESYWSTTDAESSLYFDFGTTTFMRNVVIDWGKAARHFCLQTAPDGVCPSQGSNCLSDDSTWANRGFHCIDDPVEERVDDYLINRTARYLRINGTIPNVADGYAIRTVTVYGDTNASCK